MAQIFDLKPVKKKKTTKQIIILLNMCPKKFMYVYISSM
jgi:hypothetical protein